MIFEVSGKHRQKYAIEELCKIINVSVSGYYKSLKSPKADDDEKWYRIISEIKKGFKEAYGYRKVTFEVKETYGLKANRKKIYRIMAKYALLSRIRRKKRSKYRNEGEGFINIYENELNRNFLQSAPNEVWLQDVTELKLTDGTLYMAAIMDTYRSELIDLKYSTNNNLDLVMSATRSAIKNRKCKLLHSDRGYQYTSMPYKKLLDEAGIKISMSRAANPKDNAPMENFFGVLKTECLYRWKPKTIIEAISLVEAFVKYYNNERVILKYRGAPKIACFPREASNNES